jgi:outer membrane protein
MSFRTVMPKVVAVSVALAGFAARAEVKIGYVDFQRALLETNDGKAAKARLQAMLDTRQKEVDKEQTDLLKEKDQLDKQASTMTDSARTERQTSLQKRFLDLSQRVEKGRQDMELRQRTELQTIISKMNGIVTQIAQREGLTVVLEKNEAGIVYAPQSMDLTNELVRLYNDQAKTAPGSSTKTPAQKGG